MEDILNLQHQLEVTSKQLELLTRAVGGDTDWEDSGDGHFVNRETGETEDDCPRLLEVAQAQRLAAEAKQHKVAAEKSKRRMEALDLKLKETEITLQKTRAEAAQLNQEMAVTAQDSARVRHEVESISIEVRRGIEVIMGASQGLSERLNRVESSALVAKAATQRIRSLNQLLANEKLSSTRLRNELETKTALLETSSSRVRYLEDQFEDAVQEKVLRATNPLESKISGQAAEMERLEREKVNNMTDLAGLWPKGWLPPTLLQPYMPVSEEESTERKRKAELQDVEREIRGGIRNAVAEAARWKQLSDAYGRIYWEHSETGEAAYEMPEDAKYRPPLGRDELGNVVDPEKQLRDAWHERYDEWGRTYYENGITGEVLWEPPECWGAIDDGDSNPLTAESTRPQEGKEGELKQSANDQYEKQEIDSDGEHHAAIHAARTVVLHLRKQLRVSQRKWNGTSIEDILVNEAIADGLESEAAWDIQSVVDLAKGPDNWSYNDHESQDKKAKTKDSKGSYERKDDAESLRLRLLALSKAEERHEIRLGQIRESLGRLSVQLLSFKEPVTKEEEDAIKDSNPETIGETSTPRKVEGADCEIDALVEGGIAPYVLEGYNSSTQSSLHKAAPTEESWNPSGKKFTPRSMGASSCDVQANSEGRNSENIASSHPFQKFAARVSFVNKRKDGIGICFAINQAPLSTKVCEYGEAIEAQKALRRALISQILEAEKADVEVERDRADSNPVALHNSVLVFKQQETSDEDGALSIDLSKDEGKSSPELELLSALRDHRALHWACISEESFLGLEVNKRSKECLADWYAFREDNSSATLSQVFSDYQDAQKLRDASLSAVTKLRICRPEPVSGRDTLPPSILSLEESAGQRGSKNLSAGDFKKLLNSVRSGDHDKLDFVLPSGCKLSAKQEEELRDVLRSRKQQVEAELKERSQDIFQEQHREWKSQEKEREAELAKACNSSRLLSLKCKGLENLHTELKDFFDWINFVVSEQERGIQDCAHTAECRSVQRAKEEAEKYQGMARLQSLRERLLAVMHERSALNSSLSSRTVFDGGNDFTASQWQAEQERRISLLDSESRSLSEALVIEGQRMKRLHQEELASATHEVERLRIERDSLEDLTGLNDLIREQVEKIREAVKEQSAGRLKEAEVVTYDRVGLYVEEFPEDWVWSSEDSAKSFGIEKLRGSLGQLKGSILRSLNQRQAFRTLVKSLGSRKGFTSNSGTWLPDAERVRLVEALLDAGKQHEKELIALIDTSAAEKARAAAMQHACEVAESELRKEKRLRKMELEADNRASMQVIHYLHGELERLQEVSGKRVNSLEDALRDLRAEYTSERKRLTKVAENAVEASKRRESWISALQSELALESAQRKSAETRLGALEEESRTVGSSLRNELRGLRARCFRLILKCAALVDSARRSERRLLAECKAHSETKALEVSRREKLLSLGRKHLECLHELCCDGRALFEFFAARIADLAGTNELENNAMASLGAVPIFAAMSQSPNEIIRALALRALSGIGWNEELDTRIRGWEIKRAWIDWTEEVDSRTREGRRKTGPCRSQVSAPSSPSPVHLTGSTIEVIRQDRKWALRRKKLAQTPNPSIQESIGKVCIPILKEMCSLGSFGLIRDAISAVSVAVYHESNSESMGRDNDLLHLLVQLCDKRYSWDIRGHAAVALANLAYNSQERQAAIGSAGGIEALTSLLKEGMDGQRCLSDDDGDASYDCIDSLEAAAAAIANLVCLDDANCFTLLNLGGIELLSSMTMSFKFCDALDVTKAESVRASAAKALANIARIIGGEASRKLAESGIKPFILMCASESVVTRRNAALVLGNMAQLDDMRDFLGNEGAIEALAVLMDAPRDDEPASPCDLMSAANALWAISNLATTSKNQERVARFFSSILKAAALEQPPVPDEWLPVRVNALSCVASALFHNKENRHLLLQKHPQTAEWLLSHCASLESPLPLVEASLRCLASLSFDDHVAISLGRKGAAEVFCGRAKSELESIQSLSVTCLANLGAQDENRPRITDAGGIGVLVSAQGSSNPTVVTAAQDLLEAIEVLGKAPPVLSVSSLGIAGLIKLLSHDVSGSEPVSNPANDSCMAKSAELLAQEAWKGPKRKEEIVQEGGVSTLVSLCRRDGLNESVLSEALWALRNTLHNCPVAKAAAVDLRAIQLLMSLCDKFKHSTSDLLVAVLSTLLAAATGDPSICKLIVHHGTSSLMDIANNMSGKGSSLKTLPTRDKSAASHLSPMPLKAQVRRLNETFQDDDVSASLARSLLLLLVPFSQEQCVACGAEQDTGGYCLNCGRAMDQQGGVSSPIRAPLAR